MENELLSGILQELKGIKTEVQELRGIRTELQEVKTELKEVKIEQKKMSKSIKNIELNINKGIYEDLERIKERLNKLEGKGRIRLYFFQNQLHGVSVK